MHPYQTEQALAAALARREADAAEQLVREYGGLLNAVVRRHAPGLDADDILADALLAIWQNAGRFDGQHSFRAWAAAVARYRAIDAVRRAAHACPAGGTQEMDCLLYTSHLPATLREVGIGPERFDEMAQKAATPARQNEAYVGLGAADVKKIYEMCL